MTWPWRNRPSTGAKALRLLLDQPGWTHRRVESLAFEANGETRRSISWDFTLSPDLAIAAGPDTVAVPLATLAKRPLKRLDVRDASGSAIPVWGREQNGRLAGEMLATGLTTVRQVSLTDDERTVVNAVVMANDQRAAAKGIAELLSGLETGDDADFLDLVIAVRSLAETLAEGFLLVVELPKSVVGRRTLVKVSYDDDRLGSDSPVSGSLGGRLLLPVEVRGWSGAASWHLEVHAPESLSVQRLDYLVSEVGELVDEGHDGGRASTAHVTGRATALAADTSATLSFTPRRSGLVNQVSVGAAFSLGLLVAAAFAVEELSVRASDPSRATSLAAVALSLPAILLAFLARGHEHELVSRVLSVPRLVSFLSAVVLWSAGLLLLWTGTRDALLIGFSVLAVLQAGLLSWILSIRSVSGSR